MSITKAPGFDTRKLTEQIKPRSTNSSPSPFPPGVETTLLFQQKDFIDHAIGNLTEAIRDGAIMVTIVLFLFLLNFRTTFITLMAMPLSPSPSRCWSSSGSTSGELDDPRRPRGRHRHGRG
jgi:Cu/Ag efflux pump CusA